MREWPPRVRCLLCAIVVLVLGLCSRRYRADLPGFIGQYSGDTLWALMVFLGLGVVAPTAKTWHRALLALVISYAVEVSQLYHAPWIDAIRHTTLGGLVLGFGFLWSDLVCYTVGIAIGAAVDRLISRSVSTHFSIPVTKSQ